MSFQFAGQNAAIQERLAAFPFYNNLSAAGREKLSSAIQVMQLGKGMELLEEGALCQALLLVESGSIRVFKVSPAGREITLYQVDAGESCVLGTSCVVNDLRYPAHAVCSDASDALAVPAAVFRQLYDEEASIREFVMDLFSRRLADMMLLVEEVAFRRMDERLAAFLLEKGRVAPGISRPVEMSQEEIASHLGKSDGAVRVMLSRTLDRLQDLLGKDSAFQ